MDKPEVLLKFAEYLFNSGGAEKFYVKAQGIGGEVEGGHWTGGRHTRGSGFDKDCEKYNEAGLLAWRLIRVTGTHIKSGQAVEWIKRAMA